jgi:hypothetical protein
MENQFVLLSQGATTPVSWSLDPTNAPSWLSLRNNGDGTATLLGRPRLGTTGAFPVTVSVFAQGTSLIVGYHYTVNVSDAPAFISPSTLSYTVGTFGQNTIRATQGNFTLGNTLPSAITGFPGFANLNGVVYELDGTPAAGTAGQYNILVTDSGTAGTATESLTLNIYDVPKVTSAPLVTMFAGVPASFAVTTTGYPALATHAGLPSAAPTDPSKGNGMYFTTTGLPASLTAGNLNPLGFASGTLSVQGTPTAADVGTHKVQITAANGVGSPAQQTLTLLVYPYSPTTPVNLLTSSVFTRDANNNEVATVVVANAGSSAAQNVTIASAKVDGIAGTISPASVASIGPASTATFTITFAAGSLHVASVHVFSLSGSYSGGTFSGGGRVVLP